MKFFKPSELKIKRGARPDEAHTFEAILFVDDKMSVKEFTELCDAAFKGLTSFGATIPNGAPLLIRVMIDVSNFDKFNEDDFISHVSIIVPSFCEHFCLTKGWQREHRLAVPDNLNGHINASYPIIMRFINYTNIIPNSAFNLIIETTVDERHSTKFIHHLID